MEEGGFAITGDVHIVGPGSDMLTIDAHGGSRIFYLADDIAATLSGFTLANGIASDGGGIYNAGELTLEEVTLSGNGGGERRGRVYNKIGDPHRLRFHLHRELGPIRRRDL